MNIEEARLYLEHTSKEDFNLEEHQKENRYQAIQVVLKEIEKLQEENYKLQKCLYEEELDVQDQNRELEIRIDKAIEYIEKNFTNKDGTIWHEEIREIYNILKGE